jgi:hypothetical protein
MPQINQFKISEFSDFMNSRGKLVNEGSQIKCHFMLCISTSQRCLVLRKPSECARLSLESQSERLMLKSRQGSIYIHNAVFSRMKTAVDSILWVLELLNSNCWIKLLLYKPHSLFDVSCETPKKNSI